MGGWGNKGMRERGWVISDAGSEDRIKLLSG